MTAGSDTMQPSGSVLPPATFHLDFFFIKWPTGVLLGLSNMNTALLSLLESCLW